MKLFKELIKTSELNYNEWKKEQRNIFFEKAIKEIKNKVYSIYNNLCEQKLIDIDMVFDNFGLFYKKMEMSDNFFYIVQFKLNGYVFNQKFIENEFNDEILEEKIIEFIQGINNIIKLKENK